MSSCNVILLSITTRNKVVLHAVLEDNQMIWHQIDQNTPPTVITLSPLPSLRLINFHHFLRRSTMSDLSKCKLFK